MHKDQIKQITINIERTISKFKELKKNLKLLKNRLAFLKTKKIIIKSIMNSKIYLEVKGFYSSKVKKVSVSKWTRT